MKKDVLDNVNQAISILKQGGVVACPTDTVWGIIAPAFNKDAVERVAEIKQRKEGQWFSLNTHSKDFIKKNFEMNKKTEKMIELWPEKFTAIMTANNELLEKLNPKIYNKKSVSIRVPKYDVLLKILEGFGEPVISTSANLTAEKNCKNPAEIEKKLGSGIDFIYPFSNDEASDLSSTLVDATSNNVKVLRQGDFILNE